MALAAALLLFGGGVALYLLLDIWSLRTNNPTNPFTPLVWSFMELAGMAFVGGAAIVAGIWTVTSNRRPQP